MNRYNAIMGVLQGQYRRYRQIQAADLYKLIHQVHFGAKHLMGDTEAAQNQLEEEWNAPGKLRPGEALLDQIDPEGKICRVNLRVYRKIGGSVRTLWRIVRNSAESHIPTHEQFSEDWYMIVQMAKSRAISADADALQAFWSRMEKDAFPSTHHSERYVEANEPAYRLVSTRRWLDEQSGPRP